MKDYIDKSLPQINENTKTPVLIIGGGLTGLMCAYFLMKNNMNFILVESRKLATGVSANTTAQLSIAHDRIYDDIRKKHSKEKALSYLNSQIEGLEIIKNIINKENIKCDFKEESTVLGANRKKNLKLLNRQYDLIKDKGNFNIIGGGKDFLKFKKGIEFKNQAIFNPMKYMISIIDILIKNKVYLYENSKVTKINKKQNEYEVIINDKYKINTNKIIMACHYPFLNPDNLYFTKIYQSSSYAIAFETKLKLSANYIFLDKPYYYFRTYDDNTLIIGGNDHYTGINIDIKKCYDDLVNKIYELDKDAKIISKWFTEDCMPIDSLPFIDSYSKKHPNIILVTGFQKWGFSNSHMAAKEVVNILLDKDYNKLFKTNRWILFKEFKNSMRMIAHSINGLVLSKMFIKKHNLNDIGINSGKVTRYKNTNVLVYRETEDKFIILKNFCPHMGCSLIWNDIDKVWKSKCHGSIFDRYGKVIYGPALKDLERLN